jgi:histidinol-phosphate aminotransferase
MQFGKADLERPIHGGMSLSELRSLGLQAEEVIDFSANINPLGVSPAVKKAVAELDVSSYPDPECQDLRQALAQKTGVTTKNILVGNGSTELVHLVTRACLADGGCAVVLTPTFGEYQLACHLVGVAPALMWAKDVDSFCWNVAEIRQGLVKIKPQLVFLCNPNNPTGLYLDKEAVQQIAKAAMPGVLVIDEAYLPFVEKSWDSTSLLETDNVVLLHSMTKDHALAGLRLGYAMARMELIDRLKLCQPSWSVNIAAQVAGLAALADHGHVTRARKLVTEAKAYMYAALGELGLRALPSDANFLLIEVSSAGTVRLKLLQRRLCVRDCASFGLPQYIRVAVRSLPECRRLVASLKEVCRG